MSLQQAEGWYLWEKLMVMPRQALRRTVASGPRRAHLASILVLLLTAAGLLVTPTFGDSREEIHGYGQRRMAEGLERMVGCISEGSLESVLKCQGEAYRIFEEGLQWCMAHPESCGGLVICPEGFTLTDSGVCVAALDPCAQCDALFRECRAKVSQGIVRCKNDKYQYATNVCGNLLDHCNGNPISIWLDDDPPVICHGELTVSSSTGRIYCDGDLAGSIHSNWIICRAEFEPGKEWFELPRCVNASINHCIDKCLLTDAGAGVTLSGGAYGFSGGVSYTVPPHTGYNAACIALGDQAHDQCSIEKAKCQQAACRPSGSVPISPPPPTAAD